LAAVRSRLDYCIKQERVYGVDVALLFFSLSSKFVVIPSKPKRMSWRR